MLFQIALGSVMMLITVFLSGLAVLSFAAVFARLSDWLVKPPHRPKLILIIVAVSLWALAVTTVDVWVWALMLRYLGALMTLEELVYFALVSYTTLGYGDVLLAREWRILGGMMAANGMLNIGLMTAFMVEALRYIRFKQLEHMEAEDD